MKRPDVEGIERRAGKARPKRWRLFAKGQNGNMTIAIMAGRNDDEVVKWMGFDGADYPPFHNANHIASADPYTVLKLCAYIRHLEAQQGDER